MARPVANTSRQNTSRQERASNRQPRDCSNHQYKVLLSQLRIFGLGPAGRLRTVGLTSATSREGVTTIAFNLALYAANCHDLRVLIVDGNHSNPNMHRIFQLPQSPGLAELINECATASECIQDLSTRPKEYWRSTLRKSTKRRGGLLRFIRRNREPFSAPHLSVVTAGKGQTAARESFSEDNDGLLDRISVLFDLVIVDLPPVSSATSCGFPLANLDGVVFVLEAETTSDISAQKSLRQLRQQGAEVLGVAFNKCRVHLPGIIDKKLGD
jgi:Mrp family chromosome partitioning ATPase